MLITVQTSPLMCQNQDQGIVVASELHLCGPAAWIGNHMWAGEFPGCYQTGQVIASFHFLSHLIFVL